MKMGHGIFRSTNANYPSVSDDLKVIVSRASVTPGHNGAKSQMVDLDASEFPLTAERELSISELAAAINREHQLCQGAYKASLLHARRTGELLLEAKFKIPYGSWLSWLKENCPKIPERTAQAYMQVVREWERIERSATVADLGLKDAIELISESRKSKKSTACGTESKSSGAEDVQIPPLQETPIADAAIVALDEGERERILIRQLQPEELRPQDMVSEPKSRDRQLLPSIQPNSDISSNEPSSTSASLVNTTAITHGKPDIVAVEIAIGIGHLSPEQLAWVISAAANNGISDTHLKAVVKAAKKALNQRNHPEYFKIPPV